MLNLAAQVTHRVLKQQRIQELTDILLQIDENILMLSEVLTTITTMTCSSMRCWTLQLSNMETIYRNLWFPAIIGIVMCGIFLFFIRALQIWPAKYQSHKVPEAETKVVCPPSTNCFLNAWHWVRDGLDSGCNLLRVEAWTTAQALCPNPHNFRKK